MTSGGLSLSSGGDFAHHRRSFLSCQYSRPTYQGIRAAAQTKTISSREIAAPAMKVITFPGPALITAA